ncbi:MFS transporter [Rhizosaccharibacter radicis]|uniref:MFS transporter n=1 Tax=Rhizosaccharibacter radicis TaxID=2782605 RepID=A0ABT1VZS0_9PROT|nr:MFS transporter [Acetobacteraceae bacterium KSS12]
MMKPIPTAQRNGTGLHAVTMTLFFAASSTPSPLYPLFQHRWHFSPLTLTVVYAVYSLALLAALLTAGGLSDQLGRRPVILAAVGLELLSMLLFIGAPDVGWLVGARVVQGVATGLATAALGAAIMDADHAHGSFLNATLPMLGLGAGALGSSFLARWAPMPLHLGFGLLTVLFAVQGVLTLRHVEPPRPDHPASPRRPFPLRPRIAVPDQARAALLAASPVAIALWALGGFFLSLLPSLMLKVAGGVGGLASGIAVAVLTGSAMAATVVARRHPPALMLPLGAAALLAGTGGILAGVHLASVGLLAAGSVLAGIGFGTGWFGSIGSVMPLAPPQERAALMSAFYVECYLANALPVMVAGAAVGRFGLIRTADGYGAAIIVLSALAVLAAAARLRQSRRPALSG